MWNPQVKKITVSQKYSNVPTSLSGTPCKSNDKYTQKEGSVIYCWLVTHWIIFGPCNTPFNGRPTYVLQVLAYRWLYPTQVILAQHSYCLLKFLILDHLLYTSTSCGSVKWRGKATSGQNIWQRRLTLNSFLVGTADSWAAEQPFSWQKYFAEQKYFGSERYFGPERYCQFLSCLFLHWKILMLTKAPT